MVARLGDCSGQIARVSEGFVECGSSSGNRDIRRMGRRRLQFIGYAVGPFRRTRHTSCNRGIKLVEYRFRDDVAP